MNTFQYNDMAFAVERSDRGWDITRQVPGGGAAWVGAGLFAGASESEARERGRALVRIIYPAGVRIVGPDVAHPVRVGGLRIVGPDVAHGNFVHWDKDSTSLPR